MRNRVFKTDWFNRFARKEGISDGIRCDAVARAERGLVDADLGGGLIKQRVARPGAGKSGGYRTLIFFRAQTRSIFAFGFAKSDRDNLDKPDEVRLKKAAKIMLTLSTDGLNDLVDDGMLVEVHCG